MDEVMKIFEPAFGEKDLGRVQMPVKYTYFIANIQARLKLHF
jgi:hypothetical protein